MSDDQENAASDKVGAGVPASDENGMREDPKKNGEEGEVEESGCDCSSCGGCCGPEDEKDEEK